MRRFMGFSVALLTFTAAYVAFSFFCHFVQGIGHVKHCARPFLIAQAITIALGALYFYVCPKDDKRFIKLGGVITLCGIGAPIFLFIIMAIAIVFCILFAIPAGLANTGWLAILLFFL